MSLDSAMKVLSTPVQQQAISQKEVAAATVEQETNAKNDVKIAEPVKESGGVDAKQVETPKPTEEPLSAKFAALTKKEKAIVKRDQELKARDVSFAEREAKIAEREAKIKESESLWDTDPLKALELRGYDYTKLTSFMLDGKLPAQETDPVKLAKKTIEDFKREQAEEKTKQETASKKAAEEAKAKEEAELTAAWEAYNTEVNAFVAKNTDDYELINTYSQQHLIGETVDEFYKINKKVLSIKEASDMVEKYLESEAQKALKTKKFGGKASAPTAEKKEAVVPATKTLTNSMQPTSASTLPPASEQDRMKRAMAALDRSK